MLSIQYRMHPKICHFPNAMYYDGKLTNSTNVLSRKSCLDILQPYLIFSLSAHFSLSQEYANRSEADCVIRLLNAIMDLIANQKDLKSCSIGIVTPYNNQKGGITDKLKDIK